MSDQKPRQESESGRGTNSVFPKIEHDEPTDWRSLQRTVKLILSEAGYEAEEERTLSTARGDVEVDVYALDATQEFRTVFLFECKHWCRAVDQSEIHAFRMVTQDAGADRGIMISRVGFQSGARKAVKSSNVQLLTYREFESTIADRWYNVFMRPRVVECIKPLRSFVDGERSFALSGNANRRARDLEHRYFLFEAIARLYTSASRPESSVLRAPLPLRSHFGEAAKMLPSGEQWAEQLMSAAALRELLEAICSNARRAVDEFSDVYKSDLM